MTLHQLLIKTFNKNVSKGIPKENTPLNNVTYSGFSIHDGTLLRSKSQYTTVKHSRQLFEHT
jgi:hypothetical protein